MPEEPRLTSPKEVRALLEKLGHRPNKGLGQNYLIDANILDIIAHVADIQPDESVLEIGPGLGALTERIIPMAKSVTCIEKDPTMVKYLKSRLSTFTLIESDALDVDLDALFASGITKVAANLPYSVASRLMVDISECEHRPKLMSLTIQKEVGDRLCSPAGDGHYGVVSILTGAVYINKMVKKIRDVEKSLGKVSYTPSPKAKLNKIFMRSIFVSKDIKKGEKFTKENIKVVRPSYGLAPENFNKVLGKKAKKNIKRGTPLKKTMIVSPQAH